MKTPFSFRTWGRGCLLLFVFTTLPVSSAQCGPLGRALGAIKGRVDHALNKIGIGKDREPSRDKKDAPTTEAADPQYAPSPMPDRQTSPHPPRQQPSTKPGDSTADTSENLDRTVAGKSSGMSSKPRSPAGKSKAPVAGEKRQQPVAATGPGGANKGAPSKSNTASQVPVPLTEPESTAPSTPAKINFAKPVPGKRGFVYAPGSVEDLKNILDVRGAAPGQKMKDPRTGLTFLVP